MKKLLFILCVLPVLSFSQEIVEEKIDEFTKDTIVRTSWEVIHQSFDFNAFQRVTWINSRFYLDIKLGVGAGKVFSVPKDAELMFKLYDGTIVKLYNLEFTVTNTGDGARGLAGSNAQGAQLTYPLDKKSINQLKQSNIDKIRIYLNDSYVESEVSEKAGAKVKTAIEMLE